MCTFQNIAIMSPNRYFCLGLKCFYKTEVLTPTKLHICHSLKSLQDIMNNIHVSGVALELFGDNESIFDSFKFSDYLRTYPGTINVMMINSFGKLKKDCLHCRDSKKKEFPPVFYNISKYCQCNNYPSQWDRLLTEREYQVIKLFCCGRQGKYISEELGLSVKTVSAYKIKALKKLGCSSVYSLFLKTTNQSRMAAKF